MGSVFETGIHVFMLRQLQCFGYHFFSQSHFQLNYFLLESLQRLMLTVFGDCAENDSFHKYPVLQRNTKNEIREYQNDGLLAKTVIRRRLYMQGTKSLQ